MSPMGLTQAREWAARHGWELIRTYRDDLGWAYLLIPVTGDIVILYNLDDLSPYLPRS